MVILVLDTIIFPLFTNKIVLKVPFSSLTINLYFYPDSLVIITSAEEIAEFISSLVTKLLMSFELI